MISWNAQWIWLDQHDRRPYNQTIIARKNFDLPAFTSATLAITVDSAYRLFINGEWIEDGPCRSWPRHFQYDVIDVTTRLRPGRNVIVVFARHFGFSTFHQEPLEAGLLAQLDVTTADGSPLTIATDESWHVQESSAHRRDTQRISIQMEQFEWYDATAEFSGVTSLDFDDNAWAQACAYYHALEGPWQDLHPRDVRFLTREPLSPISLSDSAVVNGMAYGIGFNLQALCQPEDHSANGYPIDGVIATVLISDRSQQIDMSPASNGSVEIFCNGQHTEGGKLFLQEGANLLTILVHANYGHGYYNLPIAFRTWTGITPQNPCDAQAESPWIFIGPFQPSPMPITNNETTYPPLSQKTLDRQHEFGRVADTKTLSAMVRDAYRTIPNGGFYLLHSNYLDFLERRPLHDAGAQITNRSAMLADNSEWSTIQPAPDGDIELCFDMGKEVVGWVEFEIIAPGGTVVDANLIEYRDGEKIQHTGGNQNGFRYIAHEGLNHFVSYKRRAGQFLFLTLRQMTGPVHIRLVRIVQATYPVEYRGGFTSSDLALNRIWDMSVLTLKLCMEDTYTDCPLYEQTLWVGDARNESLYNAIVFGADDITLRCLRITAQSLDFLPITGSQVPSGWDILLPAWSFLWGINVWDYYFATGDRTGLTELYPAVIKNLRGAQRYCTERGLFKIDAWNFFDWAPIENSHTVLHNSLLLIGAIDAARKCCDTLEEQDGAWLSEFRTQVSQAILALWDPEKGSYPDGIRNDGTVSPSTSHHTSALGLLYGVLPEGTEDIAIRNILTPPEGMVRVNSPFALQYFLEALEKAEKIAEILSLVRELWQPMLDSGDSTCWETFGDECGEFPTRSRCHAWSSAPIYVLNRLVLGIQPEAPGMREVVITPHPLGLSWARGGSATPCGDLHVAWTMTDSTLALTVDAPEGIHWRVKPNPDWHGISRVLVNGEDQSTLLVAGV